MKVSGGPTQDEIMAVSLFKLGIKKGDVLVDIGCGTGKVSIEASRICSKVYALDVREEAIKATLHNVSESGQDNVTVLEGEASDLLPDLGVVDAAFIGGSKNLGDVLRQLVHQVRGTIVVNAVLLRTLETAVSVMKELDIFQEAIVVQVSRSHDLADSIMFKPIDPVYIVIGKVN